MNSPSPTPPSAPTPAVAGRLRPALTAAVRRLLAWRAGLLALRSLHRYLSINGTERAVVLAGQTFSAVIPLLIVVSTVVSSKGGLQIADDLTRRFHLSGNAADAVHTLFAQPPGTTQSITVGSVLLLVVSGLSMSRTLQRIYEAAWQLPPRGLRGTLGGLAALGLLLTQILLLSLLAGFLHSAPASSVLTLAVRSVVSVALWLALQYLLLGRRVAWRRLIPGAVAAGVGQQGIAALSTLWIPHVIERNATRYGAIGVSFALLSWLVLIALVLVLAAAVSVEFGGGPALPNPAAGIGPAAPRPLARLLGTDDAGDGAAAQSREVRPAPGGEPAGHGGDRRP